MKLCIDPGHGGHDAGAVFQGLKEKDLVLDICLCLCKELLHAGHQVVLTRVGDVFVPLHERAALANRQKCDFFISIHLNADPDEDFPGMHEASGEEIWVYPKSPAKEVAQRMAAGIDSLTPGKWRGVKEGSFCVLRRTDMPAILVECGFIDSLTDARTLKNAPDRAARIIATSLLGALKQPVAYHGDNTQKANPSPKNEQALKKQLDHAEERLRRMQRITADYFALENESEISSRLDS